LSAETDAVEAMLSARPGAVALPSARGVALHKVMGKMFAILEVRRARYLILKCDPLLVEILKEQYAGVGHRSHLDRRFWICIDLDADVPAEEVERLVGQSYDLVRATLTRKQQAELAALAA
jgi:predicted DNA-binding protein (MmcQ/YjbR family)